jgi:hypothetical protein
MVFVYICSTWDIVELRTRFLDVKNKKWCKCCKYVSPFLLITVMAYLCSQWTPYVQIKYFMFHWSIYRLFVLNRGWNRDSLQIVILVYVCSTCSVVVLQKRFENWKATNDVNGVSLFKLSCLIRLMAFLRSNWTRDVYIKYFMFDWSIYRLSVLNTGWKSDSLQMMIYLNVCSTSGNVQLITRFETWNTKNWRKWCKFV